MYLYLFLSFFVIKKSYLCSMNKRVIIIILIIAAVCIALGAIGLARSSSSEEKPGSSTSDCPTSRETGSPASESSEATSEITVDVEREKRLLEVSLPSSLPSVRKDYEGFYVSFNPENHTPNWVAWELRGDETQGAKSRHNQFWNDPDLEGCPYTTDYSRSGYDRGHMCPAADQKWSDQAMNDCFVMANMCPQDHALNSGAWGTLENKSRLWAKRDSVILIVAGPIYESAQPKVIGESKVKVPDAFFKVLAAPFLEKPRGIAFIYPNMKAPGNMEQYVTTIDEVEALTGFDFFASFPQEIQSIMESRTSFKEWNRR